MVTPWEQVGRGGGNTPSGRTAGSPHPMSSRLAGALLSFQRGRYLHPAPAPLLDISPAPAPLLDVSRAPTRTVVLTLVSNGIPGELGNGSCLSPTREVLGLLDLSELPVIPGWSWLAVRGGLWEVGEPWAGGRGCPLKTVKCRVSGLWLMW